MKNVFSLIVAALLVFLIAKTYANPEILTIQQNTDSVGLYDKFEVQLRIKADFINPFDAEEIDLTATFTAPSGKQWHIPGFYNYANWNALWMIRFSPNETGEWNYVLHVRDNNGQDTSRSKILYSHTIAL